MLWFPLTLLATLAISLFVVASKYLLRGEKVDPIALGALLQLIVSVCAFASLPFFGTGFTVNPSSLLLTILVCLLYVISSTTYYTALKHMEASRLVIIISLDALFTQITAYFLLQEPLSFRKIAAAAIIVSAVVLVTFSTKTLSITFTRYDLLAVVNALVYSVAALLDSYLVNHYYAPTTYQAVNFGLTAVLVLLIFPKSRRALPHLFHWQKKLPLLLLTSFLLFLTYVGTLNAYRLGGEVSRVTPILATQTLVVIGLEFFLLKDRQNWPRKIIASLLAITGVTLLKG